LICLASISLWYYIAILDKDTARQTQQIYFLIIALIAVYNWLKHVW
jgi:predicted nucleic acid-binding Zn ribbon protein